mmetsp:Transcript_27915/g.59308  ORF Transcript_27915/g.59308 Transcript_27915/m.59308 type:complete len:101 (-) Transcript_27915:19-321(-)
MLPRMLSLCCRGLAFSLGSNQNYSCSGKKYELLGTMNEAEAALCNVFLRLSPIFLSRDKKGNQNSVDSLGRSDAAGRRGIASGVRSIREFGNTKKSMKAF